MKFVFRVLLVTPLIACGFAQGTLADYQRGQELRAKTRDMVVHLPGPPTWIGDSSRFWYSRSVAGGHEFLLVDADSAEKKAAFDHEKLAAAINTASGGHYTALALPFAPVSGGRGGTGGGGRGVPVAGGLTFSGDAQSIEFGAMGFHYKCSLTAYTCTKGAALRPDSPGAAGRGAAPEDEILAGPEVAEFNTTDGVEDPMPAPQQETRREPRRSQPPCAEAGEGPVCRSFDGKWDAVIENFNVFLRPAGKSGPSTALSTDGSEGSYYTLRSVAWSPDSRKLAAYHTRPGYDRQVHYIESSPADQIQPKHSSILYRKPGDALDIAYPALFDVAAKKEIDIDHALFPNAYNLTMPVWWKDGRGFTFEYNQRGHQVYRVIEVDAQTGKARALITEESPTFIDYQLLPTGKRYRYNLEDGKEILWGSERDGWEHLYLYDGISGAVKRQVTKGNWVVRAVDFVDEEKKQIWFQASGMNPEDDPYFNHYYRINFDGTGLTKLTEANGNHSVSYSASHFYYVDTWSRIDLPTTSQLRRTDVQTPVMDLEKGDASALLAAGMHMPEVFAAKGRDGKTDIWGTIVRPTNFDPAKKYPVVEQIYAGPQGSFVPKTFTTLPATQALAELGFIVVQIDGMGTNNRGKAFHNVAWKNLGDAGFPDRILWHKAAAAKYPWYDASRVGIYGTSAGGQNALGGMLFHPDFYKVAVTNSGCHDNRMDKIWWNELWMSWPIGPEYTAASNVDNAAKLEGRVLIIIGEMDSNVDPASSLQVVNALVKANKHFDMMFIPGQNHGVPVLASQHYLQDYFVHYLLGVEPPDWNHVSLPAESTAGNN